MSQDSEQILRRLADAMFDPTQGVVARLARIEVSMRETESYQRRLSQLERLVGRALVAYAALAVLAGAASGLLFDAVRKWLRI